MLDVSVLYNYEGSDLFAVLERLRSFKDSSKIVQSGLREAGRYLKKRGKSRLQNRMISGSRGVTGSLLRSFVHKLKKKNSGVLVGFNSKKGKNSGRHSWLVSEGTAPRETRKGDSRGRTRPNYFWSETREKNSPEALKIIMNSIDEAIDYLKRRGKY